METITAPAPRRSRLRRALPLAAGAVALALTLSGCLKLDMALTVNSDDKVDGVIVFAVDKSLLTLSGQSPEDAFKDTLTEAPFPTSEAGGGSVKTEVYDEGGKYGQKYTMTGLPLSSFDGTDDDGKADDSLKLVREGEFFVATGVLDLANSSGSGSSTDSGASSSPDPIPSALLAGFEVQVSVTFPGEVVEHNGTVEGTTVTWKPKAGEKLEMRAKAKASGGTGIGAVSSVGGAMTYGLIALAVLLVVGLLVALLVRRGRHETAVPALAGAGGDAMAPPSYVPAPPAAAPDLGAMPAPAMPPPPMPAPVSSAPAAPAPAAPVVPDAVVVPPAAPAPEAPAVNETLVLPDPAVTEVVDTTPPAPDVPVAPESPAPPAPPAPPA